MYLEADHAWLPLTQDSTVRQLTAVLTRSGKPLQRIEDYINLLMLRLDWMMQQNDPQTSRTQMQQAVNQGQLYQIDLPPIDAPNMEWAQALTIYNFEFQERLMFLHPEDLIEDQNLLEFPLEPIPTTQKVKKLIRETTLNEWLERMVAVCS
jgi:hypothetical protein